MIKLSIKIQRPSMIFMHWFRDEYPHRIDGPATAWIFKDNKRCWRYVDGWVQSDDEI